MLPNTSIEARARALFGKRCRYLRRQGYIPANVYGASIDSVPVQVETKEVLRVLSTISRNTPIQISISGEREARTAFVWGVQREPVTGAILHVDFYHVEAGHKMRAQVPLVLVNVNPNLEKLDRRINMMLHVVEVETLPEDLPTQINVDATILVEIDSEVKVKDLVISENVHILTPGDSGIAKVVGIVEEVEEVPEAAVEEAASAEPETVERKRKPEEEEA
ncbi:MAG: large subunit ribosomal protein [Dehalococcoidia bacterium]|nr:large subunit ribosomal protein [Dehalococcoidia bacterium]